MSPLNTCRIQHKLTLLQLVLRAQEAAHKKSEAEATTTNATSISEGSTYVPTGSGSNGLNPLVSRTALGKFSYTKAFQY